MHGFLSTSDDLLPSNHIGVYKSSIRLQICFISRLNFKTRRLLLPIDSSCVNIMSWRQVLSMLLTNDTCDSEVPLHFLLHFHRDNHDGKSTRLLAGLPPAYHPTLATNKECIRKTCFQSPQVLTPPQPFIGVPFWVSVSLWTAKALRSLLHLWYGD